MNLDECYTNVYMGARGGVGLYCSYIEGMCLPMCMVFEPFLPENGSYILQFCSESGLISCQCLD